MGEKKVGAKDCGITVPLFEFDNLRMYHEYCKDSFDQGNKFADRN